MHMEAVSSFHLCGLSNFYSLGASFKITASDKSRTEPTVECKLHVVHLTTDDQHTLQLDPTFVPSPHLQASSAQTFQLPLGRRILCVYVGYFIAGRLNECLYRHAQILDGGKLLLIIEDSEVLCVYLDSPAALDHALSRGRSSAKRTLHRDKIGSDVILAYDEQKRMLSVCASSKVRVLIDYFSN
jgi:hypothetical protein